MSEHESTCIASQSGASKIGVDHRCSGRPRRPHRHRFDEADGISGRSRRVGEQAGVEARSHINAEAESAGRGRRRAEPVGLRLFDRLLTAEEEQEMALRIKAGDAAAREKLILANTRLVVSIAARCRHNSLTTDDIIQEGILGLMRAVEMFDPQAHQVRFSTYATYWIRNAIQRAFAANHSLIRLPAYMSRLRRRVERLLNEHHCQAANGTAASPPSLSHDEIAERLGVPSRIIQLLFRSMLTQTGHNSVNEDGGETSFDDIFLDDLRPDADSERAETMTMVHDALNCLVPFEEWVIRCRFGLTGAGEGQRLPAPNQDDPRELSYAEASAACGLSVYRVRRVETTALGKLRDRLSRRLNQAM